MISELNCNISLKIEAVYGLVFSINEQIISFSKLTLYTVLRYIFFIHYTKVHISKTVIFITVYLLQSALTVIFLNLIKYLATHLESTSSLQTLQTCKVSVLVP